MDEKEVILRAKKDVAAFDYIYQTYFGRIYNYVYLRVADRDVAEEIVSNVFYKAMDKLYLFRWKSVPFSAWLYRIAVSEIGNYWRRVGKLRRIEQQLSIEMSIPDDKDGEFSYEFIHQYLRLLTEEEQNLITFRFFEKKSFAEISQILKIKESTLRVRLHRSLKKLESLIPKEVLDNVYAQVS